MERWILQHYSKWNLTCTKLIFPSHPTVTHCNESLWMSSAKGTPSCRCSSTQGGDSSEGFMASIRNTDTEPVCEAKASATFIWFEEVFIADVRVFKFHEACVSIHGDWPATSGIWREAISRVDRPARMNHKKLVFRPSRSHRPLQTQSSVIGIELQTL